jgi:hypothetical protein
MNTTEITVNEQTYRIGKLSALGQFHVSRRLAPVLAAVGISLQSLTQGMKADLSDFTTTLGPVADVMSKMSDEETNYIIFTCLNVVGRKDDNRYAPVSQSGTIMYQDIDMPVMLRLVIAVLRENLGNFLQGLSGA